MKGCLLTALFAGLTLSGCASSPPHPTAANVGGPPATALPCPDSSDNRLPPDRGYCKVTGRSYTHDDISRTGATNVGDALQLLDPSITVHH